MHCLLLNFFIVLKINSYNQQSYYLGYKIAQLVGDQEVMTWILWEKEDFSFSQFPDNVYVYPMYTELLPRMISDRFSNFRRSLSNPTVPYHNTQNIEVCLCIRKKSGCSFRFMYWVGQCICCSAIIISHSIPLKCVCIHSCLFNEFECNL